MARSQHFPYSVRESKKSRDTFLFLNFYFIFNKKPRKAKINN